MMASPKSRQRMSIATLRVDVELANVADREL